MRVFTIRTIWKRVLLWTGGLTAFAGCATPDGPPLLPTSGPGVFASNYARPAPQTAAGRQRSDDPIRQAAFQEPAAPAEPVRPAPAAEFTTVDDFVRLAVERNPRLAKANLAIDAARGRHL